MKFHTTRGGVKVNLSDLELGHLKNIIAMIERKSIEGLPVTVGDGSGDDIWVDRDVTYGEAAKIRLDFQDYQDELMRRNTGAPPRPATNDVMILFNSDVFIENVCLSFRHDYGLMPERDRERLRFECKEWMRAISNNWEYFKNFL